MKLFWLKTKKIEVPTSTWEEFLALSPALQEEIYSEAYREFLLQSESTDSKISRGIFEKAKKSIILKVMGTYDLSSVNIEGILVEEEQQVENQIKEVKEEKTPELVPELLNKTSDVYASSTHFLLSVTKFAKENNITIDLGEVAPIFKLFGEYEDFNIRFTYNEATKVGEILKK